MYPIAVVGLHVYSIVSGLTYLNSHVYYRRDGRKKLVKMRIIYKHCLTSVPLALTITIYTYI